ncbi:MAG: hypothetical protein MJK12_15995 [Colwellia sp.]|nr:hypothetical protein [Colwellia sp.]
MGFNYSWFKKGATTLPNQRVFNRYFKEGKEAVSYKEDSFNGLELTKKVDDYIKGNIGLGKYYTQRERYYPVFSMTNNFFKIMAFFSPPILGAFAWLTCVFFL